MPDNDLVQELASRAIKANPRWGIDLTGEASTTKSTPLDPDKRFIESTRNKYAGGRAGVRFPIGKSDITAGLRGYFLKQILANKEGKDIEDIYKKLTGADVGVTLPGGSRFGLDLSFPTEKDRTIMLKGNIPF